LLIATHIPGNNVQTKYPFASFLAGRRSDMCCKCTQHLQHILDASGAGPTEAWRHWRCLGQRTSKGLPALEHIGEHACRRMRLGVRLHRNAGLSLTQMSNPRRWPIGQCGRFGRNWVGTNALGAAWWNVSFLRSRSFGWRRRIATAGHKNPVRRADLRRPLSAAKFVRERAELGFYGARISFWTL